MGLPLYLGAMAAIAGGLTVALLVEAHGEGVGDAALAGLGVLLLLATSQLAVGMVNWVATLLVTPRPLPRMDFSEGLPPRFRTLVVVPTMLSTAEGIAALLEMLEVRYLANRDPHLHFGLLTDFPDAAVETLPGDESLVDLARKGIEGLNQRYGSPSDGDGESAGGSTFFLFHRPRRWNAQERVWMGYERKRGKLAALNSLLRDAGRDDFSLVVGATAVLSGVRYVITLDTDTELPRDSALQFVGAMAHPLNRPRFGATGKRKPGERVTEGYGILQPRVSIGLPGANRSWFARLNSGDPGIDPYTRVVSDVYQDAFGEGSFIGKGIYDVDAFERALDGRFPENRILSHDLLEGCYARSGLLSDVQLYEGYPATYRADVARRHRWIRGDWQLAGWLLPLVPGPGKRRVANPLSALSLWKLSDNLRRSLVPVALTLLLLLGWVVLAHAWLWTVVVIGVLALPSASALLLDLARKPDEVLLRQHFAATLRTAGRHAGQLLLALAFLPYEATVNLDAIARTGWRLFVSRRRLLEWNPSVGDEARSPSGAMARPDAARSQPPPGQCGSPRSSRRRPRSCWRSWPPPRAWWRRRCSCCGSSHPESPGGSVDRSLAARCSCPARRRGSCARSRARPGRSSRRMSARTTSGCHRTTCRSTRSRASRTAHRRRTWGCRCSRTSPPTTSATCRAASWWHERRTR